MSKISIELTSETVIKDEYIILSYMQNLDWNRYEAS